MPVPADLAGLMEGSAVHYVIGHGRNMGQHRGGTVTHVWDPATGLVNILVAYDGEYDLGGYGTTPKLEPSVPYDDGELPRSWHWTDRCSKHAHDHDAEKAQQAQEAEQPAEAVAVAS